MRIEDAIEEIKRNNFTHVNSNGLQIARDMLQVLLDKIKQLETKDFDNKKEIKSTLEYNQIMDAIEIVLIKKRATWRYIAE